MANTITISVTPQDASEIKAGKKDGSISPSKLLRSAMRLHRARSEFLDIFDIYDYKIAIADKERTIVNLLKEIERRNERIDSLQDVLAQKELAERRLRAPQQTNNGLEPFTLPTQI